MQGLDAWIHGLVALLFLAGIAELALPSGGFKGYARSFLGLLVLLGVLRPVVGLMQGQWRLAWPALPAVAGAASTAAVGAAARTYESLVASQVARTASGVPGVEQARATVSFGAARSGGPPPVAGATLAVLVAPGQRPAVVVAAVQATVARALHLDPASVQVSLA